MEKMDFNVVRQHASDTYRYARNNDNRMVNSMINFYKESKKSPSIANLIMRDTIQKSIKEYTDEASKDASMGVKGAFKDLIKKTITAAKNMKKIEHSKEVSPYLHEHVENYRKMYPKTANLRQKLISTERIVFDTVKPKAGWFTKLKLAKFLK